MRCRVVRRRYIAIQRAAGGDAAKTYGVKLSRKTNATHLAVLSCVYPEGGREAPDQARVGRRETSFQ